MLPSTIANRAWSRLSSTNCLDAKLGLCGFGYLGTPEQSAPDSEKADRDPL